jgi:1-acyl-sn-glycerol-3-phosphate acyltransferase
MKSDEIQKWSFWYWLFRVYAKFVFRLYYKEIVVLGRENIPTTAPVIFSPNHQNALMDALAVVCTVPQQLVFLARADLFKRPQLRKILRFFKIMPVYRIRDGYNDLSKNDECFAKAIAILREHKALCLMPEGNHGNQRKLRPLSKGLFRIAFRAQEEKGNVPFVKIVPVGLDYSHYDRFRARLIIRYGMPIDVSMYFPAYESNPAKAYKDLGDNLRSEMKRLMLHVESGAHYDTIWALKDIYRDAMFYKMHLGAKNTLNMFSVDQQLLELLDKEAALDEKCMAQAECKVALYNNLLNELKLRPCVLNIDCSRPFALTNRSVLYLFGVPVFIYGFLNNVIAYCVASWVSTLLKDPQFRSSLRYLAGMFLVPVISVFQTLLLFWYCHSFVLCGIYLVSIYLSGLIAFDLYISTVKLVSWMRYRMGLHFKRNKYLALKLTHEDLVGFVDARIY